MEKAYRLEGSEKASGQLKFEEQIGCRWMKWRMMCAVGKSGGGLEEEGQSRSECFGDPSSMTKRDSSRQKPEWGCQMECSRALGAKIPPKHRGLCHICEGALSKQFKLAGLWVNQFSHWSVYIWKPEHFQYLIFDVGFDLLSNDFSYSQMLSVPSNFQWASEGG